MILAKKIHINQIEHWSFSASKNFRVKRFEGNECVPKIEVSRSREWKRLNEHWQELRAHSIFRVIYDCVNSFYDNYDRRPVC